MFKIKIVRAGDTSPTRRPTRKQAHDRSTTRVVWGLLALVTAVSVAFNIRDTATHTTEPLALVASIIFPLVAVLGLKVLMMVDWKPGGLLVLARYILLGGTSLMMMLISVLHTQSVLKMWHFDTLTTWAGPIGLDTVMIFLGVALTARHDGKRTPAQSRTRKRPTGQTRVRKRPAQAPAPAVSGPVGVPIAA